MNRSKVAPIPAGATLDSGEAADPFVEALVAHPFRLAEPIEITTPFLFASPHSGRVYPPSFLEASRLDPLALRRSEDAFVEELFDIVPDCGASLLAAHFPRAYIDVNRAEGELDPSMFVTPSEVRAGPRSARVAAGLGVIPRVVRDGMEIYRRKLPSHEAAFRLQAFYRPYHAALAALIAQVQARFGMAIVIDCHSMPPPTRGNDIVLGDCHGRAAAPELTAHIEKTLIRLGFTVGRNAPYAGGHTTNFYGKPATNVHAVQIELNRALYLDEKRMEKTAGFEACRGRLADFVADLVKECPRPASTP